MFYLSRRVQAGWSASATELMGSEESLGSAILRALQSAPAFAHVGLAIGAAAVVLTLMLVPTGRFSLWVLSLWSLSFWSFTAATTAGVLAVLVYVGCGRRCSRQLVGEQGRQAMTPLFSMRLNIMRERMP
jgi:hypothetical protein